MLDLNELRKRYENIRTIEDTKDKELFDYVQSLEEALRHEKNQCEDQKKLVGLYREDTKRVESELEERNLMKARLSFVSVLVDGDHMNFMDELVQDGQKGGHFAAKALIEAARDHVRRVTSNNDPNIHVKVRVYANMAGLAKTYADTGIVSSTDILSHFIQGFNMENPLCDFVDAGNGKECSDVKVRAQFEHHFRDIHCQHIIFCGSADNGYARVLGPYRGSSRISLVEGPPFPQVIQKSVIRQYNSRTSHHTTTDAACQLRLYSENITSSIRGQFPTDKIARPEIDFSQFTVSRAQKCEW
ncbi:CCCH zinc finger DNA binding protein [Penicillium sp. IBT 18751x]|nr:CCCH zinc finger DNA binding protein [Penicillium sp. IBT 18751x]